MKDGEHCSGLKRHQPFAYAVTEIPLLSLQLWRGFQTIKLTIQQYDVNKTEQETSFSEKTIQYGPHIVYIFWSFQTSPTTVKRMALISLPPCINGPRGTFLWTLYVIQFIIEWLSGKETHATCLPIFFKIFRKCLILKKCYPIFDSIQKGNLVFYTRFKNSCRRSHTVEYRVSFKIS